MGQLKPTKANLTEEQIRQVSQTLCTQIAKIAHENLIPPQLVINWDQTGLSIVPASSRTIEQGRSSKIPIVRLGDKRQITATVAVAMVGEMLLMQVLYTGKTERCHPDFDIWHTSNHWVNTETTIRLIKIIILSYVTAVREKMELLADHPAIVIFDAFKGHKGPDVNSLLEENHLIPVLVPNNCTDLLQPIDLSVNKRIKDHLSQVQLRKLAKWTNNFTKV